ncbi:MAG TPA: hypothetical protein VKZ63_16000 [Kofleriaceae bacterium]|nr:hypothetical protein [Kofleriaceae bacterium]
MFERIWRSGIVRMALCGAIGSALACGSSGPKGQGGGGVTSGGAAGGEPAPEGGGALAFSLQDGSTWNHFYRRGPVAAHVLATSGASPRLIAAFPAGNSGIGLWFEGAGGGAQGSGAAQGGAGGGRAVELAVVGELAPVERRDGMRGVRARVKVAAPSLRATGVVLSSIRVLRDFANEPASLPPEIRNQVDAGPPLVVRRTTLDGGHHFELVVEPQGGASAAMDEGGALALTAAPGARAIEVDFTFLHDDPPLTPIPLDELLSPAAAASERDRKALGFLVYREKMLAGSWRFLTYFGRDTLLSLRMLMPVMKPAGIEGALGSVIDRLDPRGEVAHEEDIGEFAALRHAREGRPASTAPIYDYKMVDDDYMLAPVLAHYLLDTEDGRARAGEFLARRTPTGETYARAIERNLSFVVETARPFSGTRKPAQLIALKQDLPVGDWRDSEDGLGGGRYSFSVNVAMVPAALEAAARLHESKLLCPASDATCGDLAGKKAAIARMMGDAWRRAAGLFEVTVPAARARKLIESYAAEQGIDPGEALAAVQGPVVFPALSLDRRGRPLPVMHSDDGFVLLFLDPDPPTLERIAGRITQPFPLGLRTPLGVVIANPALVPDRRKRALFGRDRYHGAVMWSWQQAMLAAGLARQLERTDLPESTRQSLVAAEDALWQVIRAADEVRTAEHWSWEVVDGQWRIYRFGEGKDHESNAIQLWSTVYLAVQPPRR